MSATVYLLTISVLAVSGVTAMAQAQSLRQQADRLGLLVGAAVNPAHLSESEYAGTLAREFNMVEPENAMKWPATEPERGQFNFGPGDKVVEFAEAHGMKVRGHNLLWHSHNPAWLAQGHFTAAELALIMRGHIQKVAGHYAGKVFAWDVVNEAIDVQGKVRRSIWYDQPGIGMAGQGTAYIEQAFRWAYEADPKALLFYNDDGAEGINPKSDAIYAMVKDFKQRGVPIDGVGLQMHITNLGEDLSSVDANVARLGALGLQVQITEMDVAVPLDGAGNPVDAGDLGRQAQVYGKIASLCARQAACTAFQIWGFTDRYSWIPSFTKGKKGAALLFDLDYRPKGAYDAVLQAFASVKQPPQRPGQ